jgi:L-cysteine:1D-myo-inositol 2-amino-2-deoxy-alpha-D-glucopyranoside ligase
MSKSRGNLVFVSELIARGHDPGAIRLALLQHHYRSHWEWFDEMLKDATTRLHRWRKLLSPQESTGKEDAPTASSQSLLDQLRACLADDLDTPNALDLFEAHLEAGVDDVHLARNSAERLFGLSL